MPSKRPANFLTILLATALWLGQALPVAATDVSGAGKAWSTGFAEKAIGAPGSTRIMASALLPPGIYLLTAKGWFSNNTDARRSFTCNLTGPGPSDLTWTSIEARGDLELMSHRITTITGNGASVAWKCELKSGDRGDVVGSWITLSAMRVGTYTAVNMETGTRTTSGSGWPTVVSGLLGGPVDVPEFDDPQTVASLDVGRGTWVVLAKATAKNESWFPTEIDCRIKPTHNDAAIFLSPIGKGLTLGSLAWLGVATFFSPDSIDLICESSGSAGDAQISNIEITAIKVDDSHVKLLPATGISTNSAQIFWRDAQRKACCTEYATLLLPANAWLVMVTAQTYDPFDDSGGTVYCHISLDTDTTITLDGAGLSLSPVNRPGSEGVMSLSAGISGGEFPANYGTLRVVCQTDQVGLYLGGRASSIRIILLRITDFGFEG